MVHDLMRAESIILPRSNRIAPRGYDQHRCQARNLVERCLNRLKQFRRIATRYEKLAVHFAAMVTCGCIVLWLK
jgi:transposase